MKRRDALKAIGAGLILPTSVFGQNQQSIEYFGALKPSGHRKISNFYDKFGVFKGASENRNVFLWKYLEKELKAPLVPHYQGTTADGVMGEGDCVAHAGGLGADTLAAVNINLLGKNERFIAKSSVEMLYAGSRVEIGNGAIKLRGGSHGEWMAKFLKQYGVLHRLEYRDGENYIDLRGYDPARSRKYRDSGVPDWLERFAKEHPVQEYTKVNSGKEALDAVAAGQVVLMCSSYKIHNTRDVDGYSVPYLTKRQKMQYQQGSRWFWGWFDYREQWWHAQLLFGSLRGTKRGGGVMMNSYGIWNEGPQPYGIPDGAYAIEEQYLDLMVKDWGDCWALSSYKGHEAKKIRHRLY